MEANEVKLVLGRVDDSNVIFKALVSALRGAVEMEVDAMCPPGMTSEQAHYQRGRVAFGKDFEGVLDQMREEGARMLREGEGGAGAGR